MTLAELDRYFRDNLKIEEVGSRDISLNGIQVTSGTGEPENAEIKKAAFAVDACMESFERAAAQGADMLFVHHGLFWGRPEALTGSHYKRLKFLIENNMALYAAHLPLDMHPEFGNNAGICVALGAANVEPFGEYKGMMIGFSGELKQEADLDSVLSMMGLTRESCLSVLPFGPAKIKTFAVISGGGTDDVFEAMDMGADLYITGDASHTVYHPCLERGINLVSGGHYNTETWGVRLLAERCAADTGIETFFIDVPTGL